MRFTMHMNTGEADTRRATAARAPEGRVPDEPGLGEHIHMLGRKFPSQEVLRRATGSTLQAQPYLDYLRSKYA